MSGGSQMDGLVTSYDDITHVPVISHDQTNNALAFHNSLQTTLGIASTEGGISESNSPFSFNKVCR